MRTLVTGRLSVHVGASREMRTLLRLATIRQAPADTVLY